jgi:ubiquinone/menaquinone biosynthesis C-methylase UbiE
MRIPNADSVSTYWDYVASLYLERFRHEFDNKPYDCRKIAEFAARLGPGARVCDAGCGPCGHVTHMLDQAGLSAFGVDISPHCVELARHEHPDLSFLVMNIAQLAILDQSLDGLISYYALHYLPRRQIGNVLAEFARVLKPGGELLLVLKEGQTDGWIDCPMESGQQVYWSEFTAPELESAATAGGFCRVHCEVREPLPGEIASRRIYLSAQRKPDAA